MTHPGICKMPSPQGDIKKHQWFRGFSDGFRAAEGCPYIKDHKGRSIHKKPQSTL